MRCLHRVIFNSQSSEHLRFKKRERVPIYLILDLIVAGTLFALTVKHRPSRRANAIFASADLPNAP
jgi:hypothetical protein